MLIALLVGLAAGIGAVARYGTDQIVQHQHDSVLPLGTFVINVTGSLLLGLVTGLGISHGLSHGPVLVVGAGFCGGFTTWSTFGYETLTLAEGGALAAAGANMVGSLAVGLAAAGAGLGLAQL
jgi:CrcB protein